MKDKNIDKREEIHCHLRKILIFRNGQSVCDDDCRIFWTIALAQAILRHDLKGIYIYFSESKYFGMRENMPLGTSTIIHCVIPIYEKRCFKQHNIL